MDSPHSIELTDRELAEMFGDPAFSAQFPPVLTLEQAANLVQLPVETLRSWRSRGVLNGCSCRVGKHVRILRDRFLTQIFSQGTNVDPRQVKKRRQQPL